MGMNLISSFKDAVEPVKGGPVYHVDCLRLQEAEKQKKREEKKRDIQMKKEEPEVKPEVITKKEDFEDLISFDWIVCSILVMRWQLESD